MTLLEWKKQKDQMAREKGKRYTYEDVVNELKNLPLLWNEWGIRWVKAVFLGTGKPGRDFLIALKELTGLSVEEILMD